MIEICLCLALFWVPLLVGTYQLGFNLIRAVQVTQICRDAGHMYSLADPSSFTQPAYQNLLASLMPGSMNISSTGNTVVYMSTVTYVDATACISAGLQGTSSSCPNLGKAVFTQQIPIGNASLRASNFGTPSCPASNNYVCTAAYQLTDPGAEARGFLANVIPLTSSTQIAYMAEMYVNSTDLSFFSSLGTTGEYARSVF